MSDSASSAVAPALASSESWFAKNHFLLRRLHSLTGIVPIGVFVAEHLFTNSAILMGETAFQHDIDFIYTLPGLFWMELFGIWLPIAFHGLLGMVYIFKGAHPNSRQYTYADNRRYTWMRITGMIAFVYIFFHVSTTRWGWSYGGYWDTPFDHKQAAHSTAVALQHAFPWVAIFYLVGTLAAVYHLANGLWTSAITWGITLTPASQRRWGWVCLAIGLLLAAAGVASIIAFATLPITPAEVPAV